MSSPAHLWLLAAASLVALRPVAPTAAPAGSAAQDRKGGAEEEQQGGVKPSDVIIRLRELDMKAKARRERQAEVKVPLADTEQVRSWFALCDHNGNGWLSFSEAAHSLRFTRGRFQAFDEDRDGRLASPEFGEFYMYSILHAGHFVEPREKVSEGPPPQRTPEQMRNAYDTDLDHLLSRVELTRLLADYQRDTGLAERVMNSLDTSDDGSLSLDELEGLHAVLYPVVFEEVADVTDQREPEREKTIADLFGKVEPRGVEPGSTPTPPRIVGPVGHFRRLDLDDDGYITVDDLENLLRPVRVAVRPHVVVNTLDTNGDFRLTEEELVGALTDVSR